MGEPLKDKKKNRFPSYPNVNFYDEENIKSAVEWLKDRLASRLIDYSERDYIRDVVDEAFPDLNIQNSDKMIKTCGDCGGKMVKKTEDVFIEVNSGKVDKLSIQNESNRRSMNKNV